MNAHVTALVPRFTRAWVRCYPVVSLQPRNVAIVPSGAEIGGLAFGGRSVGRCWAAGPFT